MSSIRLNDLWRSVNNEIGFYTSETFKNIPSIPGVYAWFYPLRIVTKDLYKFIHEVDVVLNYDCDTKGIPRKGTSINFSWDTIFQTVEIQTKTIDLSSFERIWNELVSEENEFDELRKVVMRASIFLPPLYVGKTNNLNNRCQQHINGTADDNNFHKRFEDYASLNNSTAKKISDLLFVAIKTRVENQHNIKNEGLIEAILKYFTKPKYSKL